MSQSLFHVETTIRDDIFYVMPDTIINSIPVRSKYYKITGQNNILYATRLNYTGEIFISKDSCNTQSESLKRFSYYFLEQDVDYFIKISESTSTQTQFEFVISCSDYIPNSQCNTPRALNCGDSIKLDFKNAFDTTQLRLKRYRDGKLYFSFTGNGEFGRFEALGCNISAIVGTCGDRRISLNTFYDYYFHRDTNYVFELSTYDTNVPVTLKFLCNDPVYENSSQMPNPISCNSNWSFNGRYRAPDIYHTSYQDYFPSSYYWMSLIGEGSYAYISDNSYTGSSHSFQLYQGNDDLVNNQFQYISKYYPYFFQKDTSYLIAVNVDQASWKETIYDFSLNCFTIPEENDCEGARSINCGDYIPIDFTNTEESLPSCTYAYGPNVYYSIIGDDKFVKFTPFNVMISLMTGECDSTTCVEPYFEDVYLFQDVYFLEEGVEYLINATSRFTNITNYPIQHSLIIECIDPLFPALDTIQLDTSSTKCFTRGMLCDDNNRATVNDIVSNDCRCQGQNLRELLCEFDTIHIYEIDTSFAIFQARKLLSSDGFIIPTSHTIFKSGEQIEFQPGFETLNGAVLEAMIEACNE